MMQYIAFTIYRDIKRSSLVTKVTKMLGNGRLEAMCFDGVKRLCHIRGKLRKKVDIGNQASLLLQNKTNQTMISHSLEQSSDCQMAGVDKPVRHCPYWPS